jgi:hypothetical protein
VKLVLLIAVLACLVLPTVASSAYLPPIPSHRSSSSYWSSSSYYRPSYPSYYGQLNGAGYPKTQYVSPYFRSNGTYVGGYWRNSPSDGFRTCSIIRC